jgi:hypothetical protein
MPALEKVAIEALKWLANLGRQVFQSARLPKSLALDWSQCQQVLGVKLRTGEGDIEGAGCVRALERAKGRLELQQPGSDKAKDIAGTSRASMVGNALQKA